MAPLLSESLSRTRSWATALVGKLGKPLALLGLCLCLTLSACGMSNGSLSGNYAEDTLKIADSLIEMINLDQDDPSRAELEASSRGLINDYVALYRSRRDVNGLASFTTMQTALNSLAGHYASYANRPLPDGLRSRLEKELNKAELAIKRGA